MSILGWFAGVVIACVIVWQFHITGPAAVGIGFALSMFGFLLGRIASRG